MYRHIQQLKNNPATENLGMKWSEEEINDLLNEIKTDIELEKIALNHKRTIGSIRGKLYNIAEHYINDKKININEVSKIVNIPVIKINEYLEKDNNKYYVVIKGRVIYCGINFILCHKMITSQNAKLLFWWSCFVRSLFV
jgi:hypothetical protein